MNEQPAAERQFNYTTLIWSALGVVAVVALIWLLTQFSGDDSRPLLPILPTPTPRLLEYSGVATSLSFSELNSDPYAYINQPIQVSGSYTPLDPPTCDRFSGPRISWALINENLQLEAVGYEPIVRLLAPGTRLTVQGIWRRYEGPAGCGKGPPRQQIWYLDVKKIVEPNPLVDAEGNPINLNIDTGAGGAVPTADVTATLQPSVTPSSTPEISPTVPGGTLPAGTPTETAVPGTLTPTLPTPTSTTPVGTAAPGATATDTAVTPTSTPSDGSQPTTTPEPLPPTATRDAGGYPGNPTPTFTPTTSPYP